MRFNRWRRPPRALANVYERLEAFRIVNGYGLFRVMTKDRCEIMLEGSADGIDWLPYEFKWKPGDVKHAPAGARHTNLGSIGRCGSPRWNTAGKSVVYRPDFPITPGLA